MIGAESAADLAGFFAEEDFASPALYKAGGIGGGSAVSVILSNPIEGGFAGGRGALLDKAEAMLLASAVPGLARGDTLTIAGKVWRVEGITLDPSRVVATVTLGT